MNARRKDRGIKRESGTNNPLNTPYIKMECITSADERTESQCEIKKKGNLNTSTQKVNARKKNRGIKSRTNVPCNIPY